ncbi:hypothetical protein SLS60_004786 [Paraconiothyrium brasiliense]|uniref:Uncharacterized protein n=1 Tax=Paraconiothyrium brasiliense TaxID=300254 RepID=A0ABR3RLH8_9PLEO
MIKMSTTLKMSTAVREDPREGRRESSTSIPKNTQLHTVIFFPIDYDDPGNQSIKDVQMAENSLSTGPRKHMVRRPELEQTPLTFAEMPDYFQDPHFERVKRRLRAIYFHDRRKVDRKYYIDEGSDTYAAEEEQGEGQDAHRFLHQMTVFMKKLEEKGFRTIYARNLPSALRHARRLKQIIDPESPLQHIQATTPNAPPKTGTSEPSVWTPTTAGKPVPDEKVMLLTYRMIGSRIHMDSRAYDAHVGESVLLYPSREEVALDSAKIYDLNAFDALAKKDGLWRPRWHRCDLSSTMSGRKECPFDNDVDRDMWHGRTQILKRGHSSCTSKVDTVDWNKSLEPACYTCLQKFYKAHKDADLREINTEMWPGVLPKRAENHILHNSHFYNYIHQEHVESLQKWGELRVFIAMEDEKDDTGVSMKDKHGKTIRKPYVVDIIKTYFAPVEKEDDQDAKKQAAREQVARERKGYERDYRAKGVTKAILTGFVQARKIWSKELSKAKKEGLITALEEDDRRRHRAEQEKREQHGSELEGQSAVDDEHDMSGETLGGDDPIAKSQPDLESGPRGNSKDRPNHKHAPEDGSASRSNAGIEPVGDFSRMPDEGPIVRCTYFSDKMHVSRLNLESNAGFESYDKINVPVIKKFALSQYRRLYRRYPEHFESLSVGARIDIGVGPKQSLFINEVTRWWFASWFDGFEDIRLQGKIAQAFADSFSQVYRVHPREPNESIPESGDDDDDYDDDGERDKFTTLYKQKQERLEPRERKNTTASGGDGGSQDNGANGKSHGKRPADDENEDDVQGAAAEKNPKFLRRARLPRDEVE